MVGSRNLGLNFDLAWPGVKTGPYGKRRRQMLNVVRGMEMVGSRNLGLNFDLAWPGVKTGPYGKRLLSGP
jgi:hypothetical protein